MGLTLGSGSRQDQQIGFLGREGISRPEAREEDARGRRAGNIGRNSGTDWGIRWETSPPRIP